MPRPYGAMIWCNRHLKLEVYLLTKGSFQILFQIVKPLSTCHLSSDWQWHTKQITEQYNNALNTRLWVFRTVTRTFQWGWMGAGAHGQYLSLGALEGVGGALWWEDTPEQFMHFCVYTYMCIVCIYVYVCVCVYCMYTYTHTHTCVYVCACVRVCVCVCVCVCRRKG